MSEYIKALTQSLFWDTYISDLDDETNKRYIIQRVLERGTREDWLATKGRYTLEVIVEEAKQMRNLDPKALAYIACISNVPEEEFYASQRNN